MASSKIPTLNYKTNGTNYRHIGSKEEQEVSRLTFYYDRAMVSNGRFVKIKKRLYSEQQLRNISCIRKTKIPDKA